MKRLLILLSFLLALATSLPAFAQCIGCNIYSGYGYGWYYPNWNYLGKWDKIAYGVGAFFSGLDAGIQASSELRAAQAEYQARRNQLENNQSIKKYYTEGIPPFAPIAPDGKPRSPQITWQDVENIR